MGFYDLSKIERASMVAEICNAINDDLHNGSYTTIKRYFSDEDTYIRKTAYTVIGKLFLTESSLKQKILKTIQTLLGSDNEKERQTAMNAAGEIGKTDFDSVREFFDFALFDKHHRVRNAVIGSLKKVSAKNPEPVLEWAKDYLHHPNSEVRREICHGIELRGRTHPQDILPLLKELQYDKTSRVPIP